VSQGLFGRYQWTDNSMGTTSASEVGARLVLSKSFRADALTASTSVSYLSLTRPLGDAGPAGDDQITVHGTLGWNHDISREWTFAADGGAVAVIPQSGNGKSQLLPVASATIAYYPTWGSGRLVVSRAVAPNLLIAQNTLTETAVATGWLPLPWMREDPTNPTFSVATTAGVTRTRLIDNAAGDTLAAYDDLIGDVALNWSPRKSVNLAFRYQLIWQSTATDQIVGATTINGFVRNTVLIQFYGRWPERLAADVPIRQTLRVDRSNLAPVGGAGADNEGGGR
jgi:hypothetical protein